MRNLLHQVLLTGQVMGDAAFSHDKDEAMGRKRANQGERGHLCMKRRDDVYHLRPHEDPPPPDVVDEVQFRAIGLV
eukprot:scaffold96611_cov38-Prasinocladus_malaysianus.AAC.1